MYLIDTDVISESRKGSKADPHVRRFLQSLAQSEAPHYLSVITLGELRRGVELLKHRKDLKQANRLEVWLDSITLEYSEHILDFGPEEAQVWGRLRVPQPENAIDKQIAATALTHGLTLVTRNTAHFSGLGVEIVNPFAK
jgi:predicted nucleic acid-binding protein